MGVSLFTIAVHFIIYIFEFVISFRYYSFLWQPKRENTAHKVWAIIVSSCLLTALSTVYPSGIANFIKIFIALFITARVLYQNTVKDVLFCVVTLIATGVFSEGIAEFMRSVLFNIRTPPLDYFDLYQLITSLNGKVLWFLTIQILIHARINKQHRKNDGRAALMLYPFILSMSMFKMVSLNIYQEIPKRDMVEIIIIGILGLASCIVIDRIYEHSLERHELANQLLREQANASYYTSSIQNETVLLNRHHEYKNSLITIAGMLCDDCRQNTDMYLNDAVEHLNNKLDLEITTDFSNKVVNAILNYYRTICKTSCIELEIEVLYHDLSFMRPLDTATLLNNAFSNALEACHALDDNEKKWIKFRIKRINDEVVIAIQNAKSKEIVVNHKEVISTKPMALTSGHGRGIFNMNETASYYRGEVNFSDHGDMFSLILRLKC